MDKAEAVWPAAAFPNRPARLKKMECAIHIGPQKRLGTSDGVVDVALGREVEDAIDLVSPEQVFDERPITDVAFHEREAGLASSDFEVFKRTRIREGVEHNDAMPMGEGEIGQVTPDKASAAGNEQSFIVPSQHDGCVRVLLP
jgi:hypothetical protein